MFMIMELSSQKIQHVAKMNKKLSLLILGIFLISFNFVSAESIGTFKLCCDKEICDKIRR